MCLCVCVCVCVCVFSATSFFKTIVEIYPMLFPDFQTIMKSVLFLGCSQLHAQKAESSLRLTHLCVCMCSGSHEKHYFVFEDVKVKAPSVFKPVMILNRTARTGQPPSYNTDN